MKEPIIVIDRDKRSCRELCELLEAHGYPVIQGDSLDGLPGLIQKSSCCALILDLDTVPVKNRHFRDLKSKFTGLFIIAVSGRSFHPELKEAMTTHIYACLCKPVDPDDLIYLVKSIFCNATNSEKNHVEKGIEGPSFRAK
jgi:DNA-binding NtrC family response regulator